MIWYVILIKSYSNNLQSIAKHSFTLILPLSVAVKGTYIYMGLQKVGKEMDYKWLMLKAYNWLKIKKTKQVCVKINMVYENNYHYLENNVFTADLY